MTDSTAQTVQPPPPIEVEIPAVNEAVIDDRPLQDQKQAIAEQHHTHSDLLLPTTTIRGRVLPFPLYTTVFLSLGVLTIIEVLIAELFIHGPITIIVLVTLSLIKAALVVWYYMHLRDDSKIYLAALILPVLIGLVATLFLAGVPPTGY